MEELNANTMNQIYSLSLAVGTAVIRGGGAGEFFEKEGEVLEAGEAEAGRDGGRGCFAFEEELFGEVDLFGLEVFREGLPGFEFQQVVEVGFG